MDKTGRSGLRTLDVGCGLRKRPGAIGIDVNPRSQADVIHDLNIFPYPFEENSFNEVICDNVLEHVTDVFKVMEELYRVAKPDALFLIKVPFYAHRNAHTDPTHQHFFGVHSFDYLIDGTPNAEFRYSTAHFRLVSVEYDRELPSAHWIDDIVKRFANSKKDFYEHRLANIFPLRELTFELVAKK